MNYDYYNCAIENLENALNSIDFKCNTDGCIHNCTNCKEYLMKCFLIDAIENLENCEHR